MVLQWGPPQERAQRQVLGCGYRHWKLGGLAAFSTIFQRVLSFVNTRTFDAQNADVSVGRVFAARRWSLT